MQELKTVKPIRFIELDQKVLNLDKIYYIDLSDQDFILVYFENNTLRFNKSYENLKEIEMLTTCEIKFNK